MIVPVIENEAFFDGLTGWTHSAGVRVIPDPMPAARLPGASYLAQWCGDATIWTDLTFTCYVLESTGIRLQVRVEYTDGSAVTHAVDRLQPREGWSGASESMLVPLNRDLHLRQFSIVNMDLHESGPVAVTMFVIFGDRVDGFEPEGGGGGEKRRRAPMSGRMMGARFLDLETKIDRILQHLEKKDRSLS
ncbi:MAG: hypothetical protein ACYTEG_09385 [Planctomycetota bacterium]